MQYSFQHWHSRTAVVGILAIMTGCAGSTVGSGVGDRLLEHPPYYAGILSDAGRAGHLPISYQRGASQDEMFDPQAGSGTPVARLIGEMNAYLDSLGLTTRINLSSAPVGRAPDVQFSCETNSSGDCGSAAGGTLDDGKVRMRLAVARPSADWVSWAAGAASNAGVDRVLLITLEVGQYWPRQKNLIGSKEVELGTRHVVSLPWLTSLDDPINVVQITGALLGPDGRALRIGAEGLLARRSTLVLSAIGGQRLITDEDIEHLRTSRREDLAGQPLVWQASLRNLVAGLLGRVD